MLVKAADPSGESWGRPRCPHVASYRYEMCGSGSSTLESLLRWAICGYDCYQLIELMMVGDMLVDYGNHGQ